MIRGEKLNRIDKNKKNLGIILLSCITLIYIASYVILEPSLIKILISFICVVLIYLSASLFKDGIVGLIKSIVNILVFSILTITVGKITKINNLPFIQTFTAVTIIFSCLYFYAKIPDRVVKFFKKYIFKIQEQNNKEDVMDYKRYRLAQNLKSNINRKNSFFNLDLKGRLNRIIFTGICAFSTFYLILNGQIVFSFIFIACGLSTLFYGIFSGIKLSIILLIYVALCLTFKEYLNITPNNKIQYYTVLTILFGTTIYFFTKLFLKMYKRISEYVNIVSFKVGENYKSCDVFLDLVCPIYKYNNLLIYKLDLKIEENEITYNDAKKINSFITDLHSHSIKDEYIIAGTNVNQNTGKAEIYIYSKKEDKEIIDKSVNKKVDEYGYSLDSITVKRDSKWKFYKENIFPDKYITQEIINRNYIRFLNKLNIKENEEQKVLYYFYFKSMEKAKEFIEEMKKNYYELESLDDLSELKEKLNLKKEQSYGVIISNKSKLGMQRMNILTKNLIDIAEKNEGKFDGWTIDKLNKEEIKLQ